MYIIMPSCVYIYKYTHNKVSSRSRCPGTVQVSGCSPARVDCLGTRSPVDVTSRLQVVLRRDQTGALFRCEAQLTLETIAPPPPTASHPLNITVHCEWCRLQGWVWLQGAGGQGWMKNHTNH